MSRKYAINGLDRKPGPLSTQELASAMEMEVKVPDNNEQHGGGSTHQDTKISDGFDNVAYQHNDGDHIDGAEKGGSEMKGEAEETDSDTDEKPSSCFVFVFLRLVKEKANEYSRVIWLVVKVVLCLLYLAYSIYSLYRVWGTESATRLLLLLVILFYVTIGRRLMTPLIGALSGIKVEEDTSQRVQKIGKWLLYVIILVGAVVYLALEVAPHRPHNLISLAGIAILILTALLLSSAPERVRWHTVFWGISLQFYLAIFMLRTSLGNDIFQWIGDRVEEFIKYTDTGSRFIFGEAYIMHPFAFQVIPIILFMNSVIAILYHIGVVQAFIASFGRLLSFCLGTTPIESVNASANIFLSLTEAPLFIKPFLESVSDAELFAIMTGGFASIAGSILGTIVAFGIPANHILAASVMSAPAALAIAKIMSPSTPRDRSSGKHLDPYKIDIGASSNLLESVSRAALDGVAIAVNVCANVLVFVAILDFADRSFEWFANQAGVEDFSLRRLLSYVFYPLMYICGVDSQDLMVMGRLVGVKFLTNVQLAYFQAAEVIKNSDILADYTAQTNGSWYRSGDDVILVEWNQTLTGGVFNERSAVMSTYILCGFCNMPALAICIGTLSALAPQRARYIINNSFKAVIAGNIACLMTGCVAGLLFL